MIKLKYDCRTSRKSALDEIIYQGKDINQGTLTNYKTCSQCKNTPDINSVIKCMNCKEKFHITCLLKPVTPEIVSNLNTNPTLWWFCLSCLTSMTEENDLENTQSTQNLKSMMEEMKLSIIHEVNATIDNKFQSIKENKCMNTDEDTGWNATAPKLFSDIVSGDARNVQTTKMNLKEKHVLLVKVKENETITDDDLASVNQSVKEGIDNLNVNFFKAKGKTGNFVIGFPNKETLEEAEEKISTHKDFSSKFSTKIPKKMLPKITITGINKTLFATECDISDKRKHDKDTARMDIIRRNIFLQSLIERDQIFDVVVVKEEPHSYTVVVKVSPEIRKAISNQGDKLYISLGRCNVSDRYHYMQCFHCQHLGHISTNCPHKDKDPVCMYCADFHSSKDCPTKGNKASHKCANCIHSNYPNIKKNAYTHNSVSSKCPTIERECKKIAENTLTLGKNC